MIEVFRTFQSKILPDLLLTTDHVVFETITFLVKKTTHERAIYVGERLTHPGGRHLGYGYDPASHRTSLTATIGATTLTTGYAYDDDGKLETVTDPLNRTYGHGYDPTHKPDVAHLPQQHEHGLHLQHPEPPDEPDHHPGGIVQGYGFTLEGGADVRHRSRPWPG